jgi:hypothetical protein
MLPFPWNLFSRSVVFEMPLRIRNCNPFANRMKDGRLIAILKQLRVIIERETSYAAKCATPTF